MKRSWGVVGTVVVVGVLVMAVVAAGYFTASAQTVAPGLAGRDLAAMPGRVFAGQGAGVETCPVHEIMENALAEALGISEEALEDRLSSGESLSEISEAEGVDLAQALESAREQAWSEAVSQGLLTQDQVDWMREHMRGLPLGCAGGSARGLMGWGRGFMDRPYVPEARRNP